MGFFWKFTRSGWRSASYVSLIFDVDPQCIDRSRNVWSTSFEELGMAMLLLHDVEVLNQPTLGATKPAFRVVVESLGFEPTLEYSSQRERMKLVLGQSRMGRHEGAGLDWGRYSPGVRRTSIELDISGLEVAGYVRAADGQAAQGRFYGGEDKLSCYRSYPDFCKEGEYYDLMPKHVVMRSFINAKRQCDESRTLNFTTELLRWIPRR